MPRPVAAMRPRKNCATGLPASASFWKRAAASSYFLSWKAALARFSSPSTWGWAWASAGSSRRSSAAIRRIVDVIAAAAGRGLLGELQVPLGVDHHPGTLGVRPGPLALQRETISIVL